MPSGHCPLSPITIEGQVHISLEAEAVPPGWGDRDPVKEIVFS